MPSSAMSSTRSVASALVSSLMEPLPVAREIMVFMGPKQIRLTVITRASRMARPAWQRIMYFFAFGNFMQAIMATIASTRTTPKPIS